MECEFEEYVVQIGSDRENGAKVSEEWRRNSSSKPLHRHDGPAKQTWSSTTGVGVMEAHYRFGQLHNDVGPSLIKRDEISGEVIREEWRSHGALHRLNGEPAVWEKDQKTGIIVREGYFEGGVEHRIDGPALIVRNGIDGLIVTQSFFRDGDLVRPPSEEHSFLIEPS